MELLKYNNKLNLEAIASFNVQSIMISHIAIDIKYLLTKLRSVLNDLLSRKILPAQTEQAARVRFCKTNDKTGAEVVQLKFKYSGCIIIRIFWSCFRLFWTKQMRQTVMFEHSCSVLCFCALIKNFVTFTCF